MVDLNTRKPATAVKPAQLKSAEIKANRTAPALKAIPTFSADRRTPYQKQQSAQIQADFNKARNLACATMDPFAAGAAYQTLSTSKEIVHSPFRHGYGMYEGLREGDGWKVAGNAFGLALDISPVLIKGTGGKTAEVFYRTMSKTDFAYLQKHGTIPATFETFISPTSAYSSKYTGVLVQFEVKPGTFEQLRNIGVRDANHPMTSGLNFRSISGNWRSNNAFFKQEKGQINIGLGEGKALETFNSNIQNFKALKTIE